MAAALAGEIVDPSEYFGKDSYPSIEMPHEFLIDDSMIVQPSSQGEKVQIFRGPNIGSLYQRGVKGETQWCCYYKGRDKITTDHIMPAGSRLKYRSNVPKYSTLYSKA